MPNPTNDEQLKEQIERLFIDDESYSSDDATLHDKSVMSSKLMQLIHQHTKQAIKMSEHCVVHGNNISHVHCCHAITRARAYRPAHNQP